MITAVIPVMNEASSLPDTLNRLKEVPEITQIVVVDGGSKDDTRSLAKAHGAKVIESAPGRGTQLNRGLQEAKEEIVVFVHADTWLSAESGKCILAALKDPKVVGGGFQKSFRDASRLMAGSRFRCRILYKLFGLFYGDQAIFARRKSLNEIGGVPEIPLMEDLELCRLLKSKGRMILVSNPVTTSARRFQDQGILKTYWRMWKVTFLYLRGTEPGKLNRVYQGRR
ncbi:MAG TPA: glycosyltransferase [Verrucomicrobiales bacterium]|nr:glycosyltransferase [Verrucomicrobiales bacterium]